MPASAADPVSSVLKNAFASHGASRNEIGTMHQVSTGLIRGGSSSSVLLGNGSLDLPDELLTVERSPSLRVRRLSTGQMETKSGFLKKKKKSVPSLVLTVRKVFERKTYQIIF